MELSYRTEQKLQSFVVSIDTEQVTISDIPASRHPGSRVNCLAILKPCNENISLEHQQRRRARSLQQRDKSFCRQIDRTLRAVDAVLRPRCDELHGEKEKSQIWTGL